MSTEETEKWIRSRIRAVLAAETSEVLTLCTPDELWARPTIYQVFKGTNTRSTKNFDSQAEAESFALWLESESGKKCRVESKLGESFKRCEYCSARTICKQYSEGLR